MEARANIATSRKYWSLKQRCTQGLAKTPTTTSKSNVVTVLHKKPEELN